MIRNFHCKKFIKRDKTTRLNIKIEIYNKTSKLEYYDAIFHTQSYIYKTFDFTFLLKYKICMKFMYEVLHRIICRLQCKFYF